MRIVRIMNIISNSVTQRWYTYANSVNALERFNIPIFIPTLWFYLKSIINIYYKQKPDKIVYFKMYSYSTTTDC